MDRIDTIIIWGHGIKYLFDILEMIDKEFQIIRVQKYEVKNMKKFVKEIYSYDYAPYWHLKDKTKYLLKTPKEVVFIFIRNQNPIEEYVGEGKFRHIESLRLKQLKEKIRDRFNPYENGIRTHHHIIHTTDNVKQTDCILKFLGFEGIKIFYNQIKFIDVPYYIKNIKTFEIKKINLEKLKANIIIGENWKSFDVKSVSIYETPHYLALKENFTIYEKYIKKFLGGPLTEYYNITRYKNLVNNFYYLKNKTDYIIIDKNFTILDGLHRASYLLYKNNKEVLVCQVS